MKTSKPEGIIKNATSSTTKQNLGVSIN